MLYTMRSRFNTVSRRILSIFDSKPVFSHVSSANYTQKESQNVSLTELYIMTKNKCESKKLPADVNPRGVFACNELDLKEVKVYGFDYDYTLAVYKSSLDSHLYNLGMECLVKQFKYPKKIKEFQYVPNFTIRGLHYDIEKGVLLKLDSFLQIQLGTVYRGLKPVPDEEVLRLYKNKTIPIDYVESPGRSSKYLQSKMVQLADLFSVPEMSLLCNVAEYFERENIDYNPAILYQDVKASISASHVKMHENVMQNIPHFLNSNKGLRTWFAQLVSAGKKLFLVTNSPYNFVNEGMMYMVGNDWQSFFDVIIVQAMKPSFFTDEMRPLRKYDHKEGSHIWDKVTDLAKGSIYHQGTVKQLQDLTGWRGSEVLYFGDHPYSDLADVTLEHGWRTGAIIQELTHEIATLNDRTFKQNCNWLQMLTQLIEDCQDISEPGAKEILASWMAERDDLRQEIKKVFNPQFGSVFRTYHNPTYFSRRLFRFADIYTSNITNLQHFSVEHVFYPRRGVMPHEYSSHFV